MTFVGEVTTSPTRALPLVLFKGLQWYLEPGMNSLASSCFVPAWAARVVPTEDEATFSIVTEKIQVELPQQKEAKETYNVDLEIHTLQPKETFTGKDVEVTRAKFKHELEAEAAAAAATKAKKDKEQNNQNKNKFDIVHRLTIRCTNGLTTMKTLTLCSIPAKFFKELNPQSMQFTSH